MRITATGVTGGVIGEEPVTILVEECPDVEALQWHVKRKPPGASDPTIAPVGDGEFEVTATTKGAYVIEACMPQAPTMEHQ